MGITSFFSNAARLMRTISKPDWKTFWLSAKICFFGIAVLGAIGFLIRVISVVLQGIPVS